MPVVLTVSDVRQALLQVSPRRTADSRTTFTAQLGTWFHRVVADLTGDEHRQSIATLLTEAESQCAEWQRILRHEAYERCVKQRLLNEFAALHELSAEVLAFWQATQSVCDWLGELAWTVHEEQPHSDQPAWLTLTDWFASEEDLEVELRQAHWTDSVVLQGRADAVLRPQPSGRWCAIEFKLGETAPAVDLGQACLYHLMLSPTQSGNSGDALALVRFMPLREELVFDAARLIEAKAALIEQVGRLAGVIPTTNAVGCDSIATNPVGCDSIATPKQTADCNSGATKTESVVCNTITTQRAPKNQVLPQHREMAEQLIKVCNNFDIAATLASDPIVGPTFVRFPLTLGKRQKVAPLKRLPEDLHIHMKLLAPPFISQERGQLVVDVQRPDRQKILFSDIRSQLPTRQRGVRQSQVPIGVNLEGELSCLDFSNSAHAHVLVAGTTGSGKSEWLRTAIAGLILSNTPETLRLVLIDPKRNAFHALRESPYLWRPIVFPDEQPAVAVLEALADEMDRRYRLMAGADSIAQLAPIPNDPLPRIVCVIDEYFDLISRNKKTRDAIEDQIARLGSKARASGIHLMIATQQPSRATIKGVIDANMSARVGLKVEKAIESKMLFGENGAECLLGHGDLLFKDLGTPKRLQAPLLTEAERAAIFASI